MNNKQLAEEVLLQIEQYGVCNIDVVKKLAQGVMEKEGVEEE